MSKQAAHFQSIDPIAASSNAVSIALIEAVSDEVLTQDQAEAIVNRANDIINALFDGKFINPDDSKEGRHWVIEDKPYADLINPEDLPSEDDRPDILEIGG